MNNKKYSSLSAIVASCLTVSIITYAFATFNQRISDLAFTPLFIFGPLLLAIFSSIIGLIQFRILQNKGVVLGGLWIFLSTLGLVAFVLIAGILRFWMCGFSGCL